MPVQHASSSVQQKPPERRPIAAPASRAGFIELAPRPHTDQLAMVRTVSTTLEELSQMTKDELVRWAKKIGAYLDPTWSREKMVNELRRQASR